MINCDGIISFLQFNGIKGFIVLVLTKEISDPFIGFGKIRFDFYQAKELPVP